MHLILKLRLIMKRRIFITLALAGALLTASAEKKDWADFARYEKANAELLAQPADPNRVVFLGNSITDGWPTAHPEFFSKNGYVGRGISGQTSYQFLSRFREDVINLKPKIVVINVATNDIAENSHPYDADRTFGNVMSMVELAEANGIQVVLTTTLPAAGFRWNQSITDAPEKIAALNARLKAYADSKGIPFADYHSALVAPDGRSLDARYSSDGVHPNSAGYEVMEDVITSVLAPLR